MTAVALLATATFGCAEKNVRAGAGALDPQRFALRQVAIQTPTNVEPCAIGHEDYRVFDNLLRFDGLAEPVRLARSATWRESHGPERAGLDSGTVTSRWLEPGRLVSIDWRTVPQGQGSYAKEGHLVLRVDGQEYGEVFRDSIYAYGSGGGAATKCHLEITFQAPDVLTFRHTQTDWALGEPRTDTPDNTEVSMWTYRLEGNDLRFLSGPGPYRHENEDGLCD